MSLETTLAGWTGPSSDTEQDKQDRTVRMVKEAVQGHSAFDDCSLSVYAKGSYANNTNVRADSDVDVAVQCHDVMYWEEAEPGVKPPGTPYTGIWTPEKLRSEVAAALRVKFPSQVEESGKVAITVHSSTSRVDADVVPCFDYRYYFKEGGYRDGTRVFPKTGIGFENFPVQQIENGNSKNGRTAYNYKKAVRVIKRIENAMLEAGEHREVPSFFMECLVYNCPDSVFRGLTWTSRVRGILAHIWEDLQGDAEPDDDDARWLEVNRCKYLFHSFQKWNRKDGRDFAYAAWNYLGLGS